MKAIFVGTNREPFVMEFENKLENLQALVGGYIQILNIKYENNRIITLVFNEDGKYYFSRANKVLNYESGERDFIVGNILVVATNEETEEFDSLNEEEIEFYLKEMSKKELLISLCE